MPPFCYFPENPDGLLHKIWHRATNYRFLNRKHYPREWRARATAAWESRLPPVQPRDNSGKTTVTRSYVNPQTQSFFFRKLPVEIRRQIYVNILGHDEILFRVTNEDTSRDANETRNEGIPFEFLCHGAQGYLSFFMSCKLAYARTWLHYQHLSKK